MADMIVGMTLVVVLVAVIVMPQRHFNWWVARIRAVDQWILDQFREAALRKRDREERQNFPQPYRKVRRQLARVMRALRRLDAADVPMFKEHWSNWNRLAKAAAEFLRRRLDDAELSAFSQLVQYGPTPGLSAAAGDVFWGVRGDTWALRAQNVEDLLASAVVIRKELPPWCRSSETLWLLAREHAEADSHIRADFVVGLARYIAGGGWMSFVDGSDPVPHTQQPDSDRIAMRCDSVGSFVVAVASPGGDVIEYSVVDRKVKQL